ncbi:Protein maternal effect lethal 26 [Halotydeus destructor]|nr:Protein maternal effect lethal 26 [Halotydeus destructor]
MSKRVRTIGNNGTDRARILSSNYLEGTFDVRCDFVHALFENGGSKRQLFFFTPFLRGFKWKLVLSIDNKQDSTNQPITDFSVVLSSLYGDEQLPAIQSSLTTQKMRIKNPYGKYGDQVEFDLVLDEPCHIGDWDDLVSYAQESVLALRLSITFQDYVQPKDKSTLAKLYKSIDTPLCDFEIQTNGGSFKVLSSILSLKWTYFETMINADHLENSSKCWIVDDISYETMKDIVVYVYCDAITLNGEERVLEIMKAAHRYQLHDLVRDCANYLYWDIDAEYALKAFVAGDLYDIKPLMVRSADIIAEAMIEDKMTKLRGYQEFAEQPDVLRLTQECFHLAARLFKNDTFSDLPRKKRKRV